MMRQRRTSPLVAFCRGVLAPKAQGTQADESSGEKVES